MPRSMKAEKGVIILRSEFRLPMSWRFWVNPLLFLSQSPMEGSLFGAAGKPVGRGQISCGGVGAPRFHALRDGEFNIDVP